MMRTKECLLAGILACCSWMVTTQPARCQAAESTAAEPAKAQAALLDMFEQELMGVVKAMPADKFNFAPSASTVPGSKYDGVRTFAQQAVHLAQANYFFFASFGGPKPPVDPKTLSTLKDKDQIVSALQSSFNYAHQVVATMTAADAYTPIAGVDGMHTRATVASFAVAHGFDHYGQMVEYLRMNGIVPPGSK